MLPILFDGVNHTPAQVLADNTLGLGVLDEAISCTVSEERNGAFDLEMEYPVSGKRFSDLITGAIIKAKPNDTKAVQMFRIYNITKPFDGVITVSAHHISYDLAKAIVLPPFTATGVNAAGSAILNPNNLASGEDYGFRFWTNIDNGQSEFKAKTLNSVRAYCGGVEGSLLDVFGGEYEWDNLTVKLHAHRGQDNGVSIEYGKNLTDLTQELDGDNTYDAVIGYVVFNDETIYSDVYRYTGATGKPKVLAVDFSGYYTPENPPTVEDLNARAQTYINSRRLDEPDMNLEISFAALWQTPEYAKIAPLERVALCDTVHVIYPQYGITASGKVIATEYNVLTERYNSIEIGTPRATLATTIRDTQVALERQKTETNAFIKESLDHAQDLLTGAEGGYIYYKRNADGQPEEIYFMDSNDTATAVNVIRMNRNGIGFSQNGINGPFNSAWTIDGQFVADNITGGVMRAGSIEGVEISGSTINFTVSDHATENMSVVGGSFYISDPVHGMQRKGGVKFTSQDGYHFIDAGGLNYQLDGNSYITQQDGDFRWIIQDADSDMTATISFSAEDGIVFNHKNSDGTSSVILMHKDGYIQAYNGNGSLLIKADGSVYVNGKPIHAETATIDGQSIKYWSWA